MKLAIATVAFKEERFIVPFIRHYQNKVDEILVLSSTSPWNGESDEEDNTARIAESLGATVIEYDWTTEEAQRNAGQEYLCYYDWILVIDPDEYFSDEDWTDLLDYLEGTNAEAVIVEGQYTYWKKGYVADPPKDYQQLVAVRPNVRFVDKRVVSSNYVVAPVWLHHFSWARTDEEVLRKISHYAHAHDFDTKAWFNSVWLNWQPGMKNVHPVSPDTLHELIPADLPPEIEALNLWP